MITKTIILVLAALLGGFAAKSRCKASALKPLCWLVFLLPFCSGGFYAASCAAVSAGLLIWLFWHCTNREEFHLHLSDPLLAVVAVAVGSVLTILWAADRGTAPWGIVHTLPILLFALVILQLDEHQQQELYCLAPLSGAVMTIMSFVMYWIPRLTERVSVAGRLSGFFEYPNVFAAFLLAGLVISVTNGNRNKWSIAVDAVLIFGIFQSGSRTAFVLLVVTLVILCLCKRERHTWLGLWGAFSVCIAWSFILPLMGGNDASDRYLLTTIESNTLLGRLLYYVDALKIIVKHPLGLGYGGYRAV